MTTAQGSYPGSELSVEQLVHALIQALSLKSPPRRQLLESGLQKISDIERDLHEALRVTRSIKNTFTLVNRLPPEVLSNVLEHRASDRDLITATHVCRHWRTTLTSNPSLWTCFRFTSTHDVDRTFTYLERSKAAPIDIRVDLDSPRGFEAFEYLVPHIARTRYLVIQGDHMDVHAASLLLRTPSPILLHLEIWAYRGLVHLPDDFLGRHAPSLRSVSFDGVHPRFEPDFPLPSLIEFKLSLPEIANPFCVQ